MGAWQVGPRSGMWLSVSEGMAPERKDGSRRAPLTEVSICRSHFQNHEQSWLVGDIVTYRHLPHRLHFERHEGQRLSNSRATSCRAQHEEPEPLPAQSFQACKAVGGVRPVVEPTAGERAGPMILVASLPYQPRLQWWGRSGPRPTSAANSR